MNGVKPNKEIVIFLPPIDPTKKFGIKPTKKRI